MHGVVFDGFCRWINILLGGERQNEKEQEAGGPGTGHGDGLLPDGRDRRRLRRGEVGHAQITGVPLRRRSGICKRTRPCLKNSEE